MIDLIGIAAVLKAVAWPISALILTLVLVYNFKGPISDFILRIVKAEASATGVKAELQISAQSIPADLSMPKIEDSKLKQAGPLNTVYVPEYISIKNTVERDFPSDLEMQKEAYMRLYAVAATERKFERIHRIIFGSQLTAVVRANMLSGRISVSDLKDIFLSAVQQNAKAYEGFGFDAWLKFILDVNLLVPSRPEDGADCYNITEMAKAYLHYIINLQLPPKEL